jgi:hypothetical protein
MSDTTPTAGLKPLLVSLASAAHMAEVSRGLLCQTMSDDRFRLAWIRRWIPSRIDEIRRWVENVCRAALQRARLREGGNHGA